MDTAFIVLLVGLTVLSSILIKSASEGLGFPPLVGYLLLGFLLNLIHQQTGLLDEQAFFVFETLGIFGLICLLFRIGLESDLRSLARQLRPASLLWIVSMACSGLMGFAAAFFWLHLPLVPSLFAGIALTATSIGIPLAVWHEAGRLDSPQGQLLLDVAELDDISGVILMALLITIAPVLASGEGQLIPLLLKSTSGFLLKALGFGGLCFLFSRFAEKPLTARLRRLEPSPDPMLMVAALGFIIAGLAEMIGFSVAIGAFFAGLTFSRDPDTVKMESAFAGIYDLLTPFFFISIGLALEPQHILAHSHVGFILLGAAVLGKVLGTSLPALFLSSGSTAVLLGLSMVPRAEIALIIMQRGNDLGSWAVPGSLFSATVLVSAATCLATPLILRPLLSRKVPETEPRS
jgi:Kef-type K+ transport system membrane component KefB